jgi:uncharacterized membrane protein (UPF0127 family)
MVAVRVSGTETILADAHPAHGLVGRTRGLMFRKSLAEGEGLDIRPCGSIHMMFMRFPIDAVFYDREFRVTKVASNVKPWTGMAFGGKGAHGVIELPAGAAVDVKPGDLLEFEPRKQGSS